MNLKTLKLLISCFMLLFMNTVVWGQKQEIPLRKNKKQNTENKYLKAPVKPINNIQAYYDNSKVEILFIEALKTNFRVTLYQQNNRKFNIELQFLGTGIA